LIQITCEHGRALGLSLSGCLTCLFVHILGAPAVSKRRPERRHKSMPHYGSTFVNVNHHTPTQHENVFERSKGLRIVPVWRDVPLNLLHLR
jgi:hypothetical protein